MHFRGCRKTFLLELDGPTGPISSICCKGYCTWPVTCFGTACCITISSSFILVVTSTGHAQTRHTVTLMFRHHLNRRRSQYPRSMLQKTATAPTWISEDWATRSLDVFGKVCTGILGLSQVHIVPFYSSGSQCDSKETSGPNST